MLRGLVTRKLQCRYVQTIDYRTGLGVRCILRLKGACVPVMAHSGLRLWMSGRLSGLTGRGENVLVSNEASGHDGLQLGRAFHATTSPLPHCEWLQQSMRPLYT